MENPQGYIYIMTNPSFPDYVKIGYADDVERRLEQLNRSECIPFAFRVYATYAVDTRLSDLKLHSLIDQLNPELRSVETFNGQPRVREFYAMPAEEAYHILESIAAISGTADRLRKWEMSSEEQKDEYEAEEVAAQRKERQSPISLTACQIPEGAVLEYWATANEPSGLTCTVVDDKHVSYEGKVYSLSALATMLADSKWSLAGPRYFKYNGEWLNDIRSRLGI